MRSIGYFASSGSMILVPNLVGLSSSEASNALSAVGLILGESTGTTTSGANVSNNGKIATQSSSSGSYVNFATVITYTTYQYQVVVPNIVNLSTSAASSALSSAGLVLGSSTGTTVTYDTGLNGLVSSQSPTAGSSVNYGGSVSYTTYAYETPPCTGTGTIWWGYCFGEELETGNFVFYYCDETFDQALDRVIPWWRTIGGGFTANNSGPVSLNCSSGGGGGGGGGGTPPGCETEGDICDIIVNESNCTTQYKVYDSSCNCVYSYTLPYC